MKAITFEEPTGSSRDHAVEIKAAINEVHERTGAEQVDVVAHSMGGLATRWYILKNPEHRIRRSIYLGSPHRGTLSAHLAWKAGRNEMIPDSPFPDSLNTGHATPLGVDAITIRTIFDTHIVPGERANLPGLTNHELCCPTHAELLRDEDVFDLILNFLEGM